MKHVALTLAVVVTLVFCPHLASAQSWLYVTLTPWETFGRSTLIDVPLASAGLGSPERQISLPGGAGRTVVASDGRYVEFTIWAGSTTAYTLALFDRRSGQLVTCQESRPAPICCRIQPPSGSFSLPMTRSR